MPEESCANPAKSRADRKQLLVITGYLALAIAFAACLVYLIHWNQQYRRYCANLVKESRRSQATPRHYRLPSSGDRLRGMPRMTCIHCNQQYREQNWPSAIATVEMCGRSLWANTKPDTTAKACFTASRLGKLYCRYPQERWIGLSIFEHPTGAPSAGRLTPFHETELVHAVLQHGFADISRLTAQIGRFATFGSTGMRACGRSPGSRKRRSAPQSNWRMRMSRDWHTNAGLAPCGCRTGTESGTVLDIRRAASQSGEGRRA